MIEGVRNFFAESETQMLALLKELVEINSFTGNKAGTDAVASVVQRECEAIGLHVRRESRDAVGDNLVIETPARRNGKRGVLLCGHMDTVFAPELGFDTFTRDQSMLYGPGVADMKCGLVEGIYLLKALDSLGHLQDMSICMICNSDEETGSIKSSELILAEARKSDVAFVLESAKEGGQLVVGRKGRMTFELEVTGKSGHAGNAGADKASAILELSRQVQAYENLNSPVDGTTVNVGVIQGGVGANTVAEKARAVVECRYTDKACGDAVWEAVQQMAAEPFIRGTTCSVMLTTAKPAMTTNDAVLGLFDLISEVGTELGMTLECMRCGGGSDANLISQLGIPVVDGLGPIGGKLHTVDEYMVADTFVDRSVLATLSVIRAWDRYCSEI